MGTDTHFVLYICASLHRETADNQQCYCNEDSTSIHVGGADSKLTVNSVSFSIMSNTLTDWFIQLISVTN